MPPESQTPLPVQQNNRIEPYYHFHLYSWPGCTYWQHNTVAVDNVLGRAIGVGIFPYYHTITVVLLAVLCLAIINCCQNTSVVPQTLPQACLSHKNNLV